MTEPAEQQTEAEAILVRGWGTVTYPDGTVPVDDPEAWHGAQY